jgi:5,10-methylenetetrahydromethanopterin reductase
VRIGLGVGGRTVGDAVDQVRRAADDGFASAWLSNIFGTDAITTAAVAGSQVDGIELGTFVVPTFPRHPHAMAQQAMTAHDACGGRFTLGIGLSHQVVIESMLGLSFERPAEHLREYLSVLLPLLRSGSVAFAGRRFTVNAPLERPRDDGPGVLVAALGPVMLRLAGTLADGTATWMTGQRTIADHIVPSITAAAETAGRPAPRVVTGLPVCVTADPEAARERASRQFAIYGDLPSYRAMLDREGAEGPGDVAVVGDEDTVGAAIGGLADDGVTDFNAALYGSEEDVARSRSVLRELSGRSR